MTDEELLKKLEESTRDPTCHQLEVLQSILERQSCVRYLRRYFKGYNAPIDVDTFRQAVPVSTYDDYSDCISKMANFPLYHDDHGDDHFLLSVDALVCFFYSSGSGTMKPKLIPYFDSSLSKAASNLAHLGSSAIHRRLFPPRPQANKVLWFIYADKGTTTKGGFKVMAASSFPLYNTSNNWSQVTSSASPKEVVLGSNVEHQMYCHLLCGLRNADFIDGIRAPYAVGLVKAFNLLESKWKQLCDDLENGFPSLEISDISMRNSVIDVLGGPERDISKRIRFICEEKNWDGILRKLFPNVRYVRCVTTGSMEQYYQRLKHYAGDVTLLGGDYFASECCVGINMDTLKPPDTTRFVMLPTAAYFEFLPFDSKEMKAAADQEILDFSGVQVGKMYEVVVTTFRGLYRYRLGDIVRVVGFYNSSPEIEFVMRAPKSSSELITERDLMSAMKTFQLALRKEMATEITEFASFLDLELSKKQLKIFVEVKDGSMIMQEEKVQHSIVVLKRLYQLLEDDLGGLYKVQRDRVEAGPLLVTIVKPGSFDALSQVAIQNGVSASQYKPPKIIRNHEIVLFLERYALMNICFDSSDN